MKTLLYFILILSQYCFSQKPKPFKTCSKTVNYSVDDWEFRKKVGMDLKIPDCNPSYAGGVEELHKYFKANSVSNSYTYTSSISFVVNCKGKVGNYQIVNGKEDMGIYAEQVLEKVKKMPQRWKPAISKEDKPVDSYQILQFTIVKGKFRDVDYK